MSRGSWEADPRRWGFYEEDENAPVLSRAARAERVSLVMETHEDDELYDAALEQRELEETSAEKPVEADKSELSGQEAVRVATEAAADLMRQSRAYPGIAWAVGVFEESGRARLYATSNEGSGFLPPGLQWDPRLRHIFGPAVSDEELGLCLCLANPSRTVLDHYFLLRSLRPGLRITAIASTQPPGAEVAEALRTLGASALPPAQTEAAPPNSEPTRLHAVSGGSLSDIISNIPVRELWAAGLDLAADAAQQAELHKLDPALAAVLDGLRSGRATPHALEQSLHAWWRFSADAQSRRVPDTRLGPVDTSSRGTTFEQAVALGAASDYCPPFFAARASWMLHALIQSRLNDEPLGETELAELAYEHSCITERLEPTRELLARRAGGDEEDGA